MYCRLHSYAQTIKSTNQKAGVSVHIIQTYSAVYADTCLPCKPIIKDGGNAADGKTNGRRLQSPSRQLPISRTTSFISATGCSLGASLTDIYPLSEPFTRILPLYFFVRFIMPLTDELLLR